MDNNKPKIFLKVSLLRISAHNSFKSLNASPISWTKKKTIKNNENRSTIKTGCSQKIFSLKSDNAYSILSKKSPRNLKWKSQKSALEYSN